MSKKFRSLVAVAAATLVLSGAAHADHVLLVNIHDYDWGYNEVADRISGMLESAGATATQVDLNEEGKVETKLRENPGAYDQIWVVDFSTGDDDYQRDYESIAAWYDANKTTNEIICDGRMISSYWKEDRLDEGKKLTENYYENMNARGGGILLGTDHDITGNNFQTGINEINRIVGLDLFHGTVYTTDISVDTQSPLMTFPNNMGASLFNATHTGETPYGSQPNGTMLYPVAWYNNVPDLVGISTTIPEPNSVTLLLCGALALLAHGWRRRK